MTASSTSGGADDERQADELRVLRCAQCGQPAAHVRPCDGAGRGEAEADVQARLGHASLATTGRYLAALASAENQHADAIGDMFGI